MATETTPAPWTSRKLWATIFCIILINSLPILTGKEFWTESIAATVLIIVGYLASQGWIDKSALPNTETKKKG